MALDEIYTFIWQDFCDWYIEMVKVRLYNKEDISYKTAIWTLNYTLKSAITLLHPYMPFVTEEIYKDLRHGDGLLINSKLPEAKYNFIKEESYIEKIMELTKNIRNAKANANITASKKINIKLFIEEEELKKAIIDSQDLLKKIAGVNEIVYIDSTKDSSIDDIVINQESLITYLDLSSSINKDEEIKKLQIEREKIESELKRARGMLSNESFVKKAPEKLIEAERQKEQKYLSMLEKVTNRLDKLI